MSTITKERLKKLIRAIDCGSYDEEEIVGWVNSDEIMELARIALASLESEPVAWDYEWASCITCEGPQDFKRTIKREAPPQWAIEEGQARNIIPLYATAPPAPVSVSVPEEIEPDDGNTFDYVEGWNSCRAAMLQGAEPVSNRDELPLDYLQGHKDGLEWAAQLAEANHPQTGDWLYDDPIDLAKAIRKGPDMPEADGNSPVILDGWALVPVEPTAEMLQSGIAAHYERSQIQIHDRPAPGPMECAYVAMLAAAPQQEVKNV